MAISPGSRHRDTQGTSSGIDNPAPLGSMADPSDRPETPVSRTSEDNDLNLKRDTTHRQTRSFGSTYATREGWSFTTTFAIAAIVLVAAFLVAFYLGSNRTNVATTPIPQAPVADSAPGTATGGNDATGSTTAPQPQRTAPGTGDAGTGGTTAPANP